MNCSLDGLGFGSEAFSLVVLWDSIVSSLTERSLRGQYQNNDSQFTLVLSTRKSLQPDYEGRAYAFKSALKQQETNG